MVTRLPFHVPVKPSIPRTWFTHATSFRNVSAAHFARYGSPGSRTVSAISPGWAPIWMVMSDLQVFHGLSRSQCLDHPVRLAAFSGPSLVRAFRILVLGNALGAFLALCGRASKQFVERETILFRGGFGCFLGLRKAPRFYGFQRFFRFPDQLFQLFFGHVVQVDAHESLQMLFEGWPCNTLIESEVNSPKWFTNRDRIDAYSRQFCAIDCIMAAMKPDSSKRFSRSAVVPQSSFTDIE